MLPNQEEIKVILNLWGMEPKYEELRGSWHDVLKVRRDGKNFYLRITPSLRHPNEILAELEWMQSLKKSGIPVPGILKLASGEVLQTLKLLSDHVSICCFEEARGRLTQKRLDFREPVIKNWARLMGWLHEHAQNYTPVNSTVRRKVWDQDSVLQIAVGEAENSTEPEASPFLQLVEYFRRKGHQSTLFLTHADLHFGNMTIDESSNDLMVFDFDDACYHFSEHDVAVALVSIRKAAWENPGLFDAQKLENLFVDTYARPCSELNLWCAYRIGLTYFWALASAKNGALDDERMEWLKNSTPWWRAQFQKIISG